MPTSRIHNLDPEKLKSIMIAAVREFSRYEYDQSSFNRIIANSGVSKGAMYYYFDSKEDLFHVIVKNSIIPLGEKLVPKQGFATAQEYWEEVERLTGLIFTFFKTDPALGRFIQRVLVNPARAQNTPTEKVQRSITQWLQEFLISGQAVGSIRRDISLELITMMTWNIWQTGMNWFFDVHKISSAEYVSEASLIMTDFFRRAFNPL